MFAVTEELAVSVEKTKLLSVKLEADVVESARIVASCRGATIAEMLSELLRPTLAKMEREEMTKRLSATAKPAEKKGK